MGRAGSGRSSRRCLAAFPRRWSNTALSGGDRAPSLQVDRGDAQGVAGQASAQTDRALAASAVTIISGPGIVRAKKLRVAEISMAATYRAAITAHMPATRVERRREPPASNAITGYRPLAIRVVSATVRASATERFRSCRENRYPAINPVPTRTPAGMAKRATLRTKPSVCHGPLLGAQREEERRDSDGQRCRQREMPRQQHRAPRQLQG